MTTPTEEQKPAGEQTPAGEAKPGEQKPAGEAKPGEQKPAGEAKPGEQKPAGAPEKYEFKTPEGVQLDAGLMQEFEGVAKELGLPQDKANKVLDLGLKLQQKHADAAMKAAADAFGLPPDKWAEATKNDKEFGGEALEQNIGIAKKAIETFGSPELKAMLGKTGLGNHPEVVRFALRVGKAISEDKLITGKTGTQSDVRSSVFSYPNSKHV